MSTRSLFGYVLHKVSSALTARLRKLWLRFLGWRIDDVIEALRLHYEPSQTNLATLDPRDIPERIGGFHDLAYLFASHQANRGIIAQDFDEGAWIWKTVTERKPATILEIGRWLGGSTILLCAAAGTYGGKVISVDLKVKAPEFAQDELIESHLRRLGLSGHRLCVGSSFTFDPGAMIALAFIDGDHSYEGVKQDFINARHYLQRPADVLFHDATNRRRFATGHEPVERFIRELLASDANCTLIREVGSIVHIRVA